MSSITKLVATAAVLGGLLLGGPAAASTVPIFDFAISLTQANAWDGVGYVWEYQVTATAHNERGLSHWVLELCPEWFEAGTPQVIDTSFFPGDIWTTPTQGGATGGDTYEVEYGYDPPTGATGLKYNYATGDQLDAPGDTDFFAFRLLESRSTVELEWTAKDGNVDDIYGTVLGPRCYPEIPEVPEPTTLLLLGGGLLGGVIARRRR